MRPVVDPVRAIVPVPIRPYTHKPMVWFIWKFFRARPGIPIHRPIVVSPKIVPVPVLVKLAVMPMHKRAIIPVSTPNCSNLPEILIKQDIVGQTPIVHPKPVFRDRPNSEQEEELTLEEQCCECEREEAQRGHMNHPRVM